MAELSNREEARRQTLAIVLDSQRDGVVESLPIPFTWARRSVVEARHRGGHGNVRRPASTFDLWFDGAPGQPPRKPDARQPSAAAAVNRIARYWGWR